MPLRSSQTKSTARPKSGRRSAASMRESVLELLKDDHKRVRKSFRDFEKLDPHKDRERVMQIVEQTCSELEAHARLEEELFYPAVRESIKEEDVIHEAEVEHKSVRMLIDDLRGMSAEDEKYAATFTVLGEYVKHHVREEEQQMFTQIERAKIDWGSMLESMERRREELMAEMGLGGGQAEESSDGDETAREKPSRARQSASRSR